MTKELEDRLRALEQALQKTGTPTEAATAQPQKTTRAKKGLWASKKQFFAGLGFALALAALAAGGTYVYNLMRRVPDPVPASIRQAVNFPVYYPAQLPMGAYIDKKSFSESQGVVVFTVVYDTNKRLVFTEQAPPPDYDYQSLQGDAKKMSSSIGDAYAGALGNNTAVTIHNDKAWVIIGIPSEIDTSKLQTILNGLTAPE